MALKSLWPLCRTSICHSKDELMLYWPLNPGVSVSLPTPCMCVLLTQIYIYFILFYFFFPGKYLLPYASTQQAWSATGSETTNLVRMRSQTLGKSAPSLTASLVSIPQTNRVQPVIMWWIPCSNTRERHCIIGTK